MIKQAPKSVLGGIGSGFGSAIDSTLSGIKGVVAKPAEGFKQDGASGLAIGALQGVAGLLVKPATGVMDLVSKTSQGIESATSQTEQGQDNRLRPPRVFYGKEKVIRNYDVVHANLLLLVPKLRYRLPEYPNEPLELDMNFFVDAWILEENTPMFDWSLLITTTDQLIRINRYNSEQAMKQDLLIKERERLG